MSAFEAIQIIIDFDLYTIELIALVVKLDKNDKKK
ncbi:MAG: putative holin-like toxin [Lactococcus sp.]|nr:putative holin-like toxin [Lactococcus sp.]MBP6984886.1 putative holin-like toxin [Lactococcus sp.]MBR2541639.1 putative holin-like toxin [Lactococcus sp.]QIW57205.1 putative holin-like toxin [Lactococcus raffinolactis]